MEYWKRVKPFVKPSLPFLSKGFQDASLLLLCFLAAAFPSRNSAPYDKVFWKLSIPYFCFYTLGFFGNILCGIVSSLHGRNGTYMIFLIPLLFGNLLLLGALPFTLQLLPLHAVAFSFIGIGNVSACCCILPNVLENLEDRPKQEKASNFILTTWVPNYVGFGLVIFFGSLLHLLFGEKYRNWIIFLLLCQSFGLHIFTILSISETRESSLFTSSMTSQKLNFFTLMKCIWSCYLKNWNYIMLFGATLLFLTCNSLTLWFVLFAENWSWMAKTGRFMFYFVWIIFAASRILISFSISKLINKFGYNYVFLFSCSVVVAMECLQFLFQFRMISFLLGLTYTCLAPVIVILTELFLMHIVPSRIRSSWMGLVKSMENIGAFSVMIPILVLLRPNKNEPIHLDRVNHMRLVLFGFWLLIVLVGYWLIHRAALLPDIPLR
ncbi:uncharacterized protein Gasu_29770 [Galdieria sulphuraria]|uniref:Uncharacterized protein n=1 Tax=Galdieria sulphuraria TaxID=130081 RepID=M2Y0S9_GALSU|nr:uncharacterized protein Gasu_29770 [Galdieria sulphuraria]EME29533.1 hypothetical protein Gasu_29770 [Galdieria sulphuraria]|eukprot:XP_005706053.1 hypothetical protein Gasu_29770 [Galdieria sulphuraria]